MSYCQECADRETELQAALARAERAEAREAELRGMLEDAVTDLENMADETDAPESHKRSPSSFWRSRARYYQDALSPSPVAEALARVLSETERVTAELRKWKELESTGIQAMEDFYPTARAVNDLAFEYIALQAARAGRREGE